MLPVGNRYVSCAELESGAERQLGAGFPWLAAMTLIEAVDVAGVKRLWRLAHYALSLTPSRRLQGELLIHDTLSALDAYPPDAETEAGIGRELLRIEKGTARLQLSAAAART